MKKAAVVIFKPYPFTAGQKIYIEDGRLYGEP